MLQCRLGPTVAIMVSEHPLDGRCGATVYRNVGLEVHDDVLDESFVSEPDGDMVAIVLERDSETNRMDPEYEEVMQYLRNGFDTIAVVVDRSDGDDDDDDADEERIEIPDDDPYVTNHDSITKGYCERYPVKSENRDYCPVHKHRGAGGAPEGNLNGMTHGLYAQRSSYYRELDDETKMVVEGFVDDWIEMSSYDRDDRSIVNELYRIAVDQIRLWKAHDELDDGLVYDQMADYDPQEGKIYAEQENPANLPYDRLDRTTFKKLKDLGVLDSPQDKQAEATESLAEKFANIDS